MVAAAKDPKNFEGVWFHDFHNQILDLHGQVLAMLDNDLMRIQLYEETLTEPARQMVVPRVWLVGMTLYDTEYDWHVAWQTHQDEEPSE
jgi:hypothetical protein